MSPTVSTVRVKRPKIIVINDNAPPLHSLVNEVSWKPPRKATLRGKIRVEFLNILYAFHDRTARYMGDGIIVTLKKAIGLETYIKKKFYNQGYIDSISRAGFTRAAVIDIDKHQGGDEAFQRYHDIGQALSEHDIEWIGAVSSYDVDLPRGFHIYILFSRPQNAARIKELLKDLVNNVTDGKHIDIFPSGNCIRPFFVSKRDGSRVGRLLHWDGEIKCNESLKALYKLESFADKFDWKNELDAIKERCPDILLEMSGDRFNAISQLLAEVKKITEYYNFDSFPFSATMIAYYFGINIEAAKTWLRRNRHRLQLNLAGKGRYGAYFYRLAPQKSIKYQGSQRQFSFRAGNRHYALGAMVCHAVKQKLSLVAILQESERIFRATYDGDTSLDTHLMETERWYCYQFKSRTLARPAKRLISTE